LAEGEELRKVVKMFDPLGREVSDPSQASRVITSYYDSEGRLVRRMLGKAVIVTPEGQGIGNGT
jgi:YD repeat-containing protein